MLGILIGIIKFELNILLWISLGAAVIAFAGLIVVIAIAIIVCTLSFGADLYTTVTELFGESK